MHAFSSVCQEDLFRFWRRIFLRLDGASKIDHLIVTGIETPICVYLSAIDAIKHGMKVTLVTDCIGARRAVDAKQCLGQLASLGCHLLPLETLLYSMLGSSEHEVFKSVSELVRDRSSLA